MPVRPEVSWSPTGITAAFSLAGRPSANPPSREGRPADIGTGRASRLHRAHLEVLRQGASSRERPFLAAPRPARGLQGNARGLWLRRGPPPPRRPAEGRADGGAGQGRAR